MPYGFSYEEKSIKEWINKNRIDSMNRQPLAKDELIILWSKKCD